MFFWNSHAFSMIQWMLAIWFLSGSSVFSKTSLSSRKFTVHVWLKNGLENFEHYFTSMWDECNCAVVWAFFGIAFVWDWNENWPFPVLWPLLSFPNLLAYWVSSLIPQFNNYLVNTHYGPWAEHAQSSWAASRHYEVAYREVAVVLSYCLLRGRPAVRVDVHWWASMKALSGSYLSPEALLPI